MAYAQQLSSGRWRGCYLDGNKKKAYVPGTFPRKERARDAAVIAEAESREFGWKDPTAAGKLYADWVAEWWPSRTVEASTLKSDLQRMNLYVLGRWGETRLHEIGRGDVKAWANELAATPNGRGEDDYGEPYLLSPATVRQYVALLSGSLAAAVDEGILPGNPAARLKLPPPAPAHERFLTHTEYAAILNHLPSDRDRLIADSLVNTGLRFGEFAGAHWARVNEVSAVLRVVETWDPVAGRVKAYPKGKRLREVPVSAELLERWRGFVRGDRCGKSHTTGRCQSGLIVTGPQGEPLYAHNWGTRVWAPAVEAAGVGHVRVHDLRHTYASWLLQGGRSLAEVGKLLGHMSTTTTARYAWLEKSNRGDVLEALKPPAKKTGRAKVSQLKPA